MSEHNKAVPGTCEADQEEHVGSICALLKNGQLFGPFPSAKVARLWCVSQELDGYSTYDLLSPLVPLGTHKDDPT